MNFEEWVSTILAKKWGKLRLSFLLVSILFIFLFLVIGVPLIINYLFSQPATVSWLVPQWYASDVLSYYGILLSAVIAIVVLALTLRHNQKMTEKQIKLQMAQIGRPFFIIKQIDDINSKTIATDKDNSCWHTRFLIKDELEAGNKNNKIRILLENISGIALSCSYSLSHFEGVTAPKVGYIKPNGQLEVVYDFNINISDKYVDIYGPYAKQKQYFNYIYLDYSNSVGIFFRQTIPMVFSIDGNRDTKTAKVSLSIQNISAQEIM